MKVLFGITNQETVKGIVEYYKEKYNEELEYKVVFYFKQFVEELEKNKYDRAILLEELEKFATENEAQIDQYLFTKMDKITDVYNSKDVIYVASDRRRLGDSYLTKLFNLGIYSVLTGQERTKAKVCEYINETLNKKDIKKYYNNSMDNSAYNEAQVSELEIKRIVSYYQNQNKVPDKYNEIFDKIAEQYTDRQLKIIIKFLPEDVKQYLSFNNEKYKELLNSPDITMINNNNSILTDENGNPISSNNKNLEIEKESEIIEKIIVKEVNKSAPVVTEVLEKEVYQSIYEVPKDYKKVVCFVGVPKAGTTFCVNAMATNYARNKISTGIIDVTRKRDSFIIYTYDSEGKRNIAAESLNYASKGFNEPLSYEMLSVYTAKPGDSREKHDIGRTIETVMQNNSIVLIDADFTTPLDYFRLCQEIYIVQDMDVSNIHQMTLFLKELKSKGIPLSKIRLIINKHLKISITAKDILEGIRTYTSYDLKLYEELFDAKTLPYYILPFDVVNYKKYLEMLYKYTNEFYSFTDPFKKNLFKIMNSIYPIGGNSHVTVQKKTKKSSNSSGNVGFMDFLKGFKNNKSYANNDNGGFEKEIKG